MATKPKSVAVFIGVPAVLAAAIAADHDEAISASRSANLGKRSDFAGDDAAWSKYCAERFADANDGEAAVIAAAFRAARDGGKNCTVYCASDAFGSTDAKGKRTAYPTIAAADAWRAFGTMARGFDCRIVWC